jgi:hypothetical protein
MTSIWLTEVKEKFFQTCQCPRNLGQSLAGQSQEESRKFKEFSSMSRKPKLKGLFERWLSRCRVPQKAEALPSESSLGDHPESNSEASWLQASTLVLTEGLFEDRPSPGFIDRRASDRVKDRSTLLMIMGEDAAGHPLSEFTAINDVGQNGISFFLASPVKVGQVLDLTLCSPEIGASSGSAMFRVQAIVLRSAIPDDQIKPCLVAAEFKGAFATVSRGYDVDTTAQELRKAVQFDERMRQAIAPLSSTGELAAKAD